MNRQPYGTPPRWWSPRLGQWWVRLFRPLRRRTLFRGQRLVGIDVEGIEHLQQALRSGAGILITPNHSTHYDSYALYEAADRVRRPFYILTAWQVFAMSGWVERWLMRFHGCFSIDRESTDLKAFRQALDILHKGRHPLVVFPEGDIYHTNDRVTPFRDGAAAIALAAAKKAERPIVCVPCGIKFWYVEDPTAELHRLLDRLERRLLWTPRPDWPLDQRVQRLVVGMVALKELEHLGQPSTGPVAERILALTEAILSRIGGRFNIITSGATPERVKELRRLIIQEVERAETTDERRRLLAEDMDDLFFVMQLFSYPIDYMTERPTIERLAETLDKLEEDILQADLPSVRGRRRVVVRFGEPLVVRREAGKRNQTAELTELLEKHVQHLLDEINQTPRE